MDYPVSILIPIFCATEESLTWLGECIDSAIDTGAAVVLWDDGSPMDIETTIRKSKLRANGYNNMGFSVTNNGPSYARNRAAAMANTELIFPLDCDDVIKPEAIKELYEAWQQGDETPVFPDLYKFGIEDVNHFRLLDWSCELQSKKLGIASVNVLHKKSQWEAIGGWDESFNRTHIYEDAEYNARLFFTYCANNLHKPLVGYRQHHTSRIHVHKNESGILARQMLKHIGGYKDMGCCGKKRKSPSNAPTNLQSMQQLIAGTNAESLPGQDGNGRVLTTYVGGEGKLKHYKRGPVTGFPYKVQYGLVLYVDPKDARRPDEAATVSPFVLVNSVKPKEDRAPRKQPKNRKAVQ